MKYEIGIDLLYDLPYSDILDIFARLNTYTVKLNPQELLNAKYVGYFKQLIYTLGYRYVNYLINGNVVTKSQVARMKEAELSADLSIAIIDSPQTNKGVEQYYRKYEDDFDDIDTIEEKFDSTMSYVSAIYPAEDLASTNWSRYHLFYTLFTAVAHGLHGLKNLDDSPRPKLTVKNLKAVRTTLDDLSAKYDGFTSERMDKDTIPAAWATFIEQSRRGTTDTGSRRGRTIFVVQALNSALGTK